MVDGVGGEGSSRYSDGLKSITGDSFIYPGGATKSVVDEIAYLKTAGGG